ncbi:MAG: methyltransferase domain-containing protein [Candidatus Bathyarchaeia archaeon]|nr:methyltransferase domain-containing protein [Candidatus Bathyarchaeia archaeon]
MLRKEKLPKVVRKLTSLSVIDIILRYIYSADTHESNPKKILDVGCGKGEFMRSLQKIGKPLMVTFQTIGLDIFLPYLLKTKKEYNEVILCDARFLPIADDSCDVVIASQIIEHLEKKEGLKLIVDLERISKGIVAITVPVGYSPKQHLEDNNPWQQHKSGWHPDEFKKRGFKVYGYGGLVSFLAREVSLN